MARIRTIKPEFWSSPSMRGASPWARLLYIAMWNWADDSGRGTANVRELAAFAFPDDEDPIAPTTAELPSLLAEVRGRWGVIFYEVEGRRYYAIPSWDTHQRNERRAQSRHPAPQDGKDYDPSPPDQGKRTQSRNPTGVPSPSRGTSVPPRGSSGTGTGEQGNRGTGEVPPTAGSASAAAPPPAAAAAECSAQTLVAEWLESLPNRPPNAVIGHTSKAIKAMLSEGINPGHIRDGIGIWAAKGLHPSALPSAVNEAMNRPTRPTRTATALASVESAFAEWDARQARGETNLFALPPAHRSRGA